ncbi:MAG TPA: hypothetical protein VF329_05425 [Gammaproteobacteria bacterium]
MGPVNTVTSACALLLLGTAGAQQTQTTEEQSREATEEQSREGIPATRHQEEAVREISSDLFERLDEDGDGAISRQEAQAEPSLTASWSRYDRNGDDVLDSAEFSEFDTSATSSAEGGDAETGQSGPTEEGLPTTRHQQEVVRDPRVEQLDEDGDGAISRQEAQGDARLSAEWDQLDQNGDQKLDATELARLEQ